jgi:phospholipid/cholesterol/gamma-HCH transport system substrate-binding protein
MELMESEAKYTVVGTAALILIALMAAAVVWLSASGVRSDSRRYKIYFEHQSLDGLQIRSDVKMKGIRVGAVTDFKFSSRRPGAVEVVISVAPTTPIRRSTRAVVDRNLVTGLASIQLVDLSEDSPLLTKPPPGEPYPVIAEGESKFQQFSDSLTQLADRANETLGRINRTLSDENQTALAETLDNLQHLSQNAGRVLARLDGTLSSVDRAADEVRSMSSGIINDEHTLAARYDTLGEEATTALRELTAGIRQISADAAQLSERASDLLASGDMELRLTAREVRAAADSIGAATDKLGDLRTTLFGPAEGALGPGEGTK